MSSRDSSLQLLTNSRVCCLRIYSIAKYYQSVHAGVLFELPGMDQENRSGNTAGTMVLPPDG